MGTAGQLSESGLSLGPSLQRAGFISRRESDFMTAAETSGHLDWALLHTGRNLSRGFPRILDWCISVLPALLLAATATAVGFFVYAMFIPLVSLLESLAVTGTFFN